ncbi:MAG TPA: sulfatase-like hydrolase/transferase [Geobacteraceae bacterium]|nr:sulfatase-like hydrolase/transferase [Geobacteraceae bacterium]
MLRLTKNRLSPLFLLFLIFIAFSVVTRTVLLCEALPVLKPNAFQLAKIYGCGFFFDCVTFSYILIPFVIYAMFTPDRIFNCRPVAWVACFIITYALQFDMVAEYLYFAEFGSRYSFTAVDYLVYAPEVIGNIRESYPVNRILLAILLVNIPLFFFLKKYIDRSLGALTTFRQRLKILIPVVMLPVLSYLFMDLSFSAISRDACADDLAENGLYNLVAAYSCNDLDYERFYSTRNKRVILSRLRDMVKEPGNHFASADWRDLTREIRNPADEMKYNVIVVVEESMSGEFLKAFGGRLGLTPNLDRLADMSLFFTNLYATGTRTVRGLEAVTLSRPPLPGASLVRRPRNENLFSWGSLMKSRGYDTKFIYAGLGYFDNMSYFFSRNGFDIVDKTGFSREEITFDNAWGACDEDLFRKVVKEANRSYAGGKPFFSIVMTTSNHRPFTYPDGKIDIPAAGGSAGRRGGVKYADYAIGKFLEEAAGRPWFGRTLFVFVADHCAGGARRTAMPIKNYQIPMMIYAPCLIKPRKIDIQASQIDIAPTVLGLMNFSYRTRFLGRDLLKTDIKDGRAFISTFERLGYLKGDKMVILAPKKGVEYYRFDRRDGKTDEIKPDDGLLVDALGYYQGADILYKNGLDGKLQDH